MSGERVDWSPIVPVSDANLNKMNTPAGVVSSYAGAVVPAGWLLCNGAAVSRTTYAGLFAAIGTTWGSGDGSTTFNLPNLVEKFEVGAGGAYALAANGGAAYVALTTAQMPSHNHPASASAVGNHTHGISKTDGDVPATGIFPSVGDVRKATEQSDPAGAHGHTITVNAAGSGDAHENRPPYVALNKIIKY